jgi:uncharacterized protein (TIGR02466 family)
MEFYKIFPTVIGHSRCQVDESINKEINSLINSELELHKEYNFIVSKDKNILKTTQNVKNYILSEVQSYAQNALNLKKKLRITQSWITKQTSDSNIFQHRHQNSIISGAFYLNISHNQSGITFYKDNDLKLKYIDWIEDYDENDLYYDKITFNCNTCDLILFPSHVTHSVSKNKSNENRFSLSFNTWFDEPIGMWENLNYLDVQ